MKEQEGGKEGENEKGTGFTDRLTFTQHLAGQGSTCERERVRDKEKERGE